MQFPTLLRTALALQQPIQSQVSWDLVQSSLNMLAMFWNRRQRWLHSVGEGGSIPALVCTRWASNVRPHTQSVPIGNEHIGSGTSTLDIGWELRPYG